MRISDWSSDVCSSDLFADYQLPGGENYREVLLTLPMDAQTQSDYENGLIPKSDLLSKQYFSSHFPETPNIVAHVRLNDRTDSPGRRELFGVEVKRSEERRVGKGWVSTGQSRGS